MRERNPGLVGAIAAGRPVLSTAVIASGLTALAAVGFERSSISFNNAAVSMTAALALMTLAPAAVASLAPKRFWLRLLYAGFAAGVIFALRRLVLQAGVNFGPFDAGLALAVAAGATFFLAAAIPVWRAALSLSLIGLAAMILGIAGGLAVAAIEMSAAPAPAAGASLGLAAGAGAALSVQIAASFSRSFAEDGAGADAAAAAGRAGAAPALFVFVVGAVAVFALAMNEGGVFPAALPDIRIALAAIGFAVAVPLFMSTAALSLKRETEIAAVVENRRRAALRPFLDGVRRILPPSSALAASAIFFIIAIIAAFETTIPAGAGDLAVASAVFAAAAVVFVSLRTALMATVLAIAGGRILNWAIDLSGAVAPTETARAAAAALAAALSMQLFLSWRDRRNVRRKTREVVRLALADSLFAYIASSALATSAMAATEAAGVWSEGGDAALITGCLCVLGLLAAPPLMTATGALFGRQ